MTPDRRIAAIALSVIALDQLTKALVVHFMERYSEVVVIDGFFRLVHWGNTGAAWSMLHGNNAFLAIISLVALAGLVLARASFGTDRKIGQVAVGLICGGITGNAIDRLFVHHVIDFLYFYLYPRGSYSEAGFPAFNVADSAICVGAACLVIMSYFHHQPRATNEAEAPQGEQTP